MERSNGYSRREFLKVVGVTGGLAAAGCGERANEKLIPYVVQPDEVIPGVATWYTGSCFECAGGCGLLVRTREGRAVKVEGNPNHPVNQGGLCTRAQSLLQAVYDPDRIRSPLQRQPTGELAGTSWEAAIENVASTLQRGTPEKKTVLLTGKLSGSQLSAVREFTTKVKNVEHVEFDLFNDDALRAGAEKVFGPGYGVRYDLSRADLIVNFGADFLETWISPVEFARDWSSRRRPENGSVSKFVHVEPRLSLTAANADEWLKNKPGSELTLLLALLREVLRRNPSGNLSSGERERVMGLVNLLRLSPAEILQQTGVSVEAIGVLADHLVHAESSLVLAGGISISGEGEADCIAASILLNIALGNVGKSMLVNRDGEKREFAFQAMRKLVADMQAKQVGALVVSGTNVMFTLPPHTGFHEALVNVPTIIAVSTHLDETSSRANVVLPLSTSIESWLDAEPVPGVLNLNQPAMQPLYETQSLVDSLIAITTKLGASLGGGASDAREYIRAQWKSRFGEGGFEDRWQRALQAGGEWGEKDSKENPTRKSLNDVSLAATATTIRIPAAAESGNQLMLAAFPNVNFFDGTSANRPWLQEVPGTLQNIVWDSWVEIHPETASQHGIHEGQTVRVETAYGMLESPAYLTEFVEKNLLAIPIGQGHTTYGRYASGVGVNPLAVLPGDSVGGLGFQTPIRKLATSVFASKLVKLQWENSQHGRELIRTVAASKVANGHGHADEGHGDGHGQRHGHDENSHGAESHGAGHHGPVLGPRAEPPQMYKQMEHPLYKWGMTVDLAACTGCSACVVACYAENNIPVVGKHLSSMRRHMSWIRIDRYFDGPAHRPVDGFMPMMCQHCGNAPCEPVCPVYATYHNEEGLNTMVYNRCVGTRYCSNNCSYKVRRFNWFKYDWPEPSNWQLNPDVSVREVGVMEKCTFCVQRIKEAQNHAKDLGRPVQDGEIQPACASSCPTKAISFGNLNDPKSKVSINLKNKRSYRCLDEAINTQPAVTYLARVTNDRVTEA